MFDNILNVFFRLRIFFVILFLSLVQSWCTSSTRLLKEKKVLLEFDCLLLFVAAGKVSSGLFRSCHQPATFCCKSNWRWQRNEIVEEVFLSATLVWYSSVNWIVFNLGCDFFTIHFDYSSRSCVLFLFKYGFAA